MRTTASSILHVSLLILVGMCARSDADNGAQSIWPKGIVPFMIDPELNAAAIQYHKLMFLIEDNSCVRFVPWDKTSINQNGLEHQAYLNFVNGSGCWSTPIGNISEDGSRNISCCGDDFRCLQQMTQSLGVTGQDLGNQTNAATYYILRDVSKAYECGESTVCANFALTCVNDGYTTIVHGKCGCQCPSGLDPSTGCSTPLKKGSPAWPKGQYALPDSKSGCPGASFRSDKATIKYDVKTVVNPPICKKPFDDDDVMDTDEEKKFNWPAGQYCIYKRGRKCPTGFLLGSIDFYSYEPSGSPAGKIDICCQNNGFYDDKASFPTDKPFVLFRSGDKCQQVTGMSVTSQSFTIPNVEGVRGMFKVNGLMSHRSFRDGRRILLDLCIYIKTDMDCGGEITLDRINNETTIEEASGAGRTDMRCTWVVKGEHEDGHLEVDFEYFGVERSDAVEVRADRIGQKGVIFTRNKVGHLVVTQTYIAMLKFSTYGISNSSFKARVKWIPNDHLCYDVDHEGLTYKGNVSVTRDSQPCVPWTQVTNCPHHPFKKGDELADLEGNYCRNPDNSFRPWCYTDADGCQRNYCDVCKLEPVAECKPPIVPSNGEMLEETKSTYKLGDVITFRCTTDGHNKTVNTECLPSGDWSPAILLCPDCPFGYIPFNDGCYKYVPTPKTYDDAHTQCKQEHGYLATPRNSAELDFIDSIRMTQQLWLGATDKAKQWQFVLEDGTNMAWTNWAGGEPNGGGVEDCLEMRTNKEWNDVPCNTDYLKYGSVCYIPKLADKTECKAPNIPSYVEIVGQAKSAYRLGDVVTFKCKQGGRMLPEESMCLPGGDWSQVPFRCPECLNGFAEHNDRCYGLVDKMVTYPQAQHECKKLNGFIASPKDNDENNFIDSIRKDKAIWLGASDGHKTDGRLVWDDTSIMRWANWQTNVTGNSSTEDCVILNPDKSWNKITCDTRRGLVCTIPQLDTEFECQAPTIPTNGDILGDTKPTYRLGDTVTFQCRQFGWIVDTVCMAGGRWSASDFECPGCPPGYTWFNNVCYGFVDEALTFAEARAECKKYRGIVASPKSLEENNLIDSIRDDHTVWLGGTDSGTEGQHVWEDGTEMFYTNWHANQPDEETGQEDCTEMSHYGQWSDVTCSIKLRAVCAIPRLDCPLGYTWYTNQCYKFSSKKLSYDAAEAECKKDNGHLAAPKNLDESNLVDLMRHQKYIWLGATDRKKEGEFLWEDGTNVTWNNWHRGCVDGFEEYEGQCYKLVDKLNNWVQAHAECKKLGGYIATPKNAEENNFVDKVRKGHYIWSGATDRANEGKWVLEDGSKMEWAKWHGGQPDRYYTEEDCAVMTYYKALNDITCNDRYRQVCTIPLIYCPLGYIQFNDGCYKYVPDAKTYDEAHAHCKQEQTYLATPRNRAELDFIHSIRTTQQLWLGATDKAKEGQFVLEDGTKMAWTNWASGEPSNGNGREHCLEMRTNKEWNDVACYTDHLKFGSVCYISKLGRKVWDCARMNPDTMWNVFSCNANYAHVCTATRPECPRDYTEFSNACYGYIGKKATFPEAKAECKKRNGYLASPKSVEENDFIDTIRQGEIIWLSASDEDDEGSYVWEDGTKMVWKNWESGEPNGVRSENCGHMNPNKKWNDYPCDSEYKYGFVCYVPKLERKPECKAPTLPAYAQMHGETKSSYKQGEVVSFKCRSKLSTSVVDSVCLPSGEWSPFVLDCSECLSGYVPYNGLCYGIVYKKATFTQARTECRKLNGHLASPKTSEENDFVNSLRQETGRMVWLGATDQYKEGNWVWEDGTKVRWSNWASGQPDESSTVTDCALMNLDGKWGTVACNTSSIQNELVCAIPKLEDFLCRDSLKRQCPELMTGRPTMCREFPQFSAKYCAHTCGHCDGNGPDRLIKLIKIITGDNTQ